MNAYTTRCWPASPAILYYIQHVLLHLPSCFFSVLLTSSPYTYHSIYLYLLCPHRPVAAPEPHSSIPKVRLLHVTTIIGASLMPEGPGHYLDIYFFHYYSVFTLLFFQRQRRQPSRMAATEPPRSILMQRPRRWTTAHLKLAKVQPTAAASPAQMLGAEYIPADGDSGTLNAFSWWNTSHA